MKHISLAIPDNKYQFFLELIENLNFVEVEDDEEKIAMEELQNSLHQVKLMQEGKIPKQTAEDFIYDKGQLENITKDQILILLQNAGLL